MNIKIILTISALAIAVTSANAGGYSRGGADTDILYEDGGFNMRSDVTFVSPSREYSRSPTPGIVGTESSTSYVAPSFAVKLKIAEPLSCAGTFSQPYGGDAVYATTLVNGDVEEHILVNEFALTCAAKFQFGKGNFYLLGGVFQESLKYQLLQELVPGVVGNLQLKGDDYGYRLGVAYDIPEIALRGQLMYRSGTSYGADGTLTVPGALIGDPAPTVALPSSGTGDLPQSVELKLQTGVAPGWLVFGSVLWADWSTLDALRVTTPIGDDFNPHFYRDGWTVTAGVGHQFTDRVAGAVALTWDRGTSTGWETSSSDSWTVSAGGSLTDKWGGELRAGVGLSYLAALEETQYGANNSAVKAGYAYALNVGYKIKW